MHPAIYRVFEEICEAARPEGPVLEVGSIPGPDGLLQMPCLRDLPGRVGLNLDGADGGGYPILEGNANAMTAFEDGQFSAVLCNATLEHDPYFWKTLAEIRRVTAPGGLIAIGVPGYHGMGLHELAPRRSPFAVALRAFSACGYADPITAGTVTLGVHNFPGDYYRFSEQAAREIFMEGCEDVHTRVVMSPPRVLAWGRRS